MSTHPFRFLLLALPAVAWGGMFHVAARVLPAIDPYWLTLLRYAPTALCLFVLWRWREPSALAPAPGTGRAALLAGATGFGFFNFALYTGLALTTPEHGAIAMAMTPLLGVLLSWVLDRRPPATATVACIGMAVVGAMLVVGGGQHDTAAATSGLIGDGLALLGATAWAFYLRTARWFPGWSSLRFSVWTTASGTLAIAVGCLLLTPVGLAKAPNWSALGGLGGELAYLVLVGTLLALLLWNRGIAVVGPVNGALFMNLVPVSAFAIGVALGHRPSGIELVGTVLVLTALIGNNLTQRQTRMAQPCRAEN